jgi:uncharacterized protein YcfJ
MNTVLSTAMAAAALAFSAQAAAEVVFYENPNFEGRQFTAEREVKNFQRSGFNDRASSVAVLGERWEVCEDAAFRGRCVVLRPGRYPSLAAMGLDNRISSVRIVNRSARIEERRYAPAPVMIAEPAPQRDYRRRDRERLYEANVVSVRAVVGPPEQRCWIEREQVSGGNPNVPGAIVGGIIGGILGHQVGSGRGNDVATGVGAVAGAAVGSNVNRDSGGQYSQDVRRCSTNTSHAGPQYYDVTYSFRGQDHRVQMSSPPGRTVTVNDQGEPRA